MTKPAHEPAILQGARRVRYLNIGDSNQFGFLTPPHLIAAVEKAMRDGHNGYVPSPGIVEAREAAAADFVARGVPADGVGGTDAAAGKRGDRRRKRRRYNRRGRFF